jgi:hypothetical protein
MQEPTRDATSGSIERPYQPFVLLPILVGCTLLSASQSTMGEKLFDNVHVHVTLNMSTLELTAYSHTRKLADARRVG